MAGSIGGLVDGLLPLWISWKVWVWARALVLIVVGVVGILVVVGVMTVVGVGGVSMRSVGVQIVRSVVLVRSGVGSVRSGL